MESILLLILIFADLLLFLYVYKSSRSRGYSTHQLVLDIKEERRIVEELKVHLSDQIAQSKIEINKLAEKVTAMIAETEMDHEQVKKMVTEGSKELVDEFEHRVFEPLELIKKKYDQVERAVDKLRREKEFLLSAIKRAETLAKFFNKKIPYEELLEEIEDKKYLDARRLVSKGMSAKEVADSLNLTESEVKMIVSLS